LSGRLGLSAEAGVSQPGFIQNIGFRRLSFGFPREIVKYINKNFEMQRIVSTGVIFMLYQLTLHFDRFVFKIIFASFYLRLFRIVAGPPLCGDSKDPRYQSSGM
jgi:hypothetical protein